MNPEEISGQELLDAIAATCDLPAFIEQTGGGTATAFVGYRGPDEAYTLAIGPGAFNWLDATKSTFWLDDLYVGPDDHGESVDMAEVVNSREELIPAIRKALLKLDERFAGITR